MNKQTNCDLHQWYCWCMSALIHGDNSSAVSQQYWAPSRVILWLTELEIWTWTTEMFQNISCSLHISEHLILVPVCRQLQNMWLNSSCMQFEQVYIAFCWYYTNARNTMIALATLFYLGPAWYIAVYAFQTPELIFLSATEGSWDLFLQNKPRLIWNITEKSGLTSKLILNSIIKFFFKKSL